MQTKLFSSFIALRFSESEIFSFFNIVRQTIPKKDFKWCSAWKCVIVTYDLIELWCKKQPLPHHYYTYIFKTRKHLNDKNECKIHKKCYILVWDAIGSVIYTLINTIYVRLIARWVRWWNNMNMVGCNKKNYNSTNKNQTYEETSQKQMWFGNKETIRNLKAYCT